MKQRSCARAWSPRAASSIDAPATVTTGPQRGLGEPPAAASVCSITPAALVLVGDDDDAPDGAQVQVLQQVALAQRRDQQLLGVPARRRRRGTPDPTSPRIAGRPSAADLVVARPYAR